MINASTRLDPVVGIQEWLKVGIGLTGTGEGAWRIMVNGVLGSQGKRKIVKLNRGKDRTVTVTNCCYQQVCDFIL